jgi:phosphohistidine phosphatase SixA
MHKFSCLLLRHSLPFVLAFACVPHAWAAGQNVVWQALQQGGHVVLIRHAITESGIGDPPKFKLEDCRTQRNLSAQGRADAKRIGEAFRKYGVPIAQVLSSRWCRCLDTARIAFGKATPSPMLDSMFNDKERPGEEKVQEFRAALAKLPSNGNLIMVTHQYNIQAFADVSPTSGEMVVLKPESGGLELIGRLTVTDL